eukprot:CAMPEP_0116895042 /NCGR_PEP_ID=MMETSP0467-20121206/4656_1 /TAXON_ID=283647 /ORGANISM="Mesodinium pulex, Strain SPMC105" /LENGTH=123 /DNA_ID=CAMNT_0004565557 /DNA_START=1021 /DNA_END=1392 /DNA_ORIENTATION=-
MNTNPAQFEVANSDDTSSQLFLVTDGTEWKDQIKYIIKDYDINKVSKKDLDNSNNNTTGTSQVDNENLADLLESENLEIMNDNKNEGNLNNKNTNSANVDLMRFLITRNLLGRHLCPTFPDTI